MGCDLLLFMERTTAGGHEYLGEIEVPRDYHFFAALAGVRGCPSGDMEPLCVVGASWPNKLSPEMLAEAQDAKQSGGNHSFGWFDPDQFLAYAWSRALPPPSDVMGSIAMNVVASVIENAKPDRLLFYFNS